MADRIQVIIAVPIDDSLPQDVQGVGLRRRAIELMQEIATVDENTVRYKGASDTTQIDFGGDIGTVSVWQRNMLGVIFIADGKALPGVVGPVVHTDGDRLARTFSRAQVVRNEYSA